MKMDFEIQLLSLNLDLNFGGNFWKLTILIEIVESQNFEIWILIILKIFNFRFD